MAGRTRLRGNALAWKRCSPGSDVAAHGPSNIGSTDRIPCSKVALAQLVSHGVRSRPAGASAFGWDCRGHLIVPPGPRSGWAGPKVLTPTKGVNTIPLMAASLGLIGALARETSARRHAWRLFASAAALGSCCSFDGCLSRSILHCVPSELPCMAASFLHEWRRYVCRFRTSHLSRVKIELQARLRGKQKHQPPTPTNKQPTKPNTKTPGQPLK